MSMEHFRARDERPVHECVRWCGRRLTSSSEVYAHRYGYIPEGSDTSISELEYRAATDARLPRFIYVVDNQYPWLPEHIDDGDKRTRLNTFKEFLFKNHICQTFGAADQLAMNVAADLGRHISMEKAKPVGRNIPVNDIASMDQRPNQRRWFRRLEYP